MAKIKRFWITEWDFEVHPESLENKYGLVDDQDGGIIAWFNDRSKAIEILAILNESEHANV